VIPDRRLSALLIKAGRLTQEQYEEAKRVQARTGCGLAQAFEKTKVCTAEELLGVVSAQSGRPVVNLKNYRPSKEILAAVPKDFCRKHRVIPFAAFGKAVTVAVEDPFDLDLADGLGKLIGRRVSVVLARPGQIAEAIETFYGREDRQLREVAGLVEREYSPGTPGSRVAPEAVAVEVGEDVTEESAPIIRLASQIIEDAFARRASDIHIEPFPDELLVRARVDGELEPMMRLPVGASRALVSRIKIMSKLNITERRLPQDGRITFAGFSRKGVDLELRVSTLPVAGGEKVVMRLIDRGGIRLGLDALGFTDENLAEYRRMIAQPYGMILHVGPTGSGKTTTLYAALTEINAPGVNIQTAEDPIEYVLKGINQSQMHAEIGYTFARALRSFLRQDPDVILVGEIRDLETATIGVQAALTGHLLFSTLHTNDAVGTVMRLVNMGVDPFLVSSATLCVCGQRLMRRLCRCARTAKVSDSEAKVLASAGKKAKAAQLGHAAGCPECRSSGYRGRVGIHELMVMGPELRELINRKAPEPELQAAAMRAGMVPLHVDALMKVCAGVTSLDEALSVVRIT
jgi:type IV pilus assembly protein PilB